jgi:hypothetical protein
MWWSVPVMILLGRIEGQRGFCSIVLPLAERDLHCSTRRTSSRSMEICETKPIAGQLVKIWRPDLATEAAQVAETEIVCYDD